MSVMIARTSGLYHMVPVDQMRVPSVAVQMFIEHLKIEAGQGQVGVAVVVEADAGGPFDENMYSDNGKRWFKIRS